MDKEYLLSVIRERIAQLEVKYREYFDIDNGPSRTYSGAGNMRSRIKKDLGTLKLLEYVISYCPSTMIIENDELCSAVDRLTTSRNHKS